MRQQASNHGMNGEGIIDRACARTFSTLTCVNIVILHGGSLTAGQNFLPRHSTYTIFIRSVNFIERKCSLDSELSQFEEIIVIGDIRIPILDFRAICDRLKTGFRISAMYFDFASARSLYTEWCRVFE